MPAASPDAQTDAPIETDALIIGAGPAGLFQVFELGLLGIRSHVVDTLRHPGGQCAELYPDKPIYDIPALPICGAQELVDRLMKQVEPMQPVFHFGAHRVLEQRHAVAAGKLDYVEGVAAAIKADDGRLTGVTIKRTDGTMQQVEADHLLAFFGLHPKLGPIAEWGFELERKAIKVDTAKFQTNVSGIFAIGDINSYPGKKKLILSGFHEAALAAFAIAEHLNPAKKVHLQYTTTSPIMQKRLGVAE